MSDSFLPDPPPDSGGGVDSVTDVTTTGWLQRVGQSLVGAVIGIVLVVVSIVLLWWNEGRAVEAIRALDSGARQVVEAKPDAVVPANDGKLLHLTGPMETRAPARDTAFGVGADDLLRLKRTVEMFQWVEHKSTQSHKNLGGSETTETTYSYRKEWSENPVDSNHFREPDGHRNLPMPLRSATIDSSDVRLGAYKIDRALLDAVSAWTSLDPSHAASLPQGYRAEGDILYRGADQSAPAIGDIRVRYSAVKAQTMSVVAAQSGAILAPWHAASGYTIGLAEPGVVPAAAMFKEKTQEESVLTWILRVVGFVVMLIGFWLMANPLSVLVGVLPLLESLVGIGAFLLAFTIAAPLTLFVIALAWLVHRPLIGGGLIVIGLGLLFVMHRMHRRPQPTRFLPVGR